MSGIAIQGLDLLCPEITRPDQIEVGRYYSVEDKRWPGKDLEIVQAGERDGEIYLSKWNIWATKDNPQAFERWRIYGPVLPTTIVDLTREVLSLRQRLKKSLWVPVSERLPEINKAVLGLDKFGVVIGTVRFTTDFGDVYKDTHNEGEPVWHLWNPYKSPEKIEDCLIEPDAIKAWLSLDALPRPPQDGKLDQ